MNLPWHQLSRHGDEAAQSGAGRVVVSSQKPRFRHCGGDTETDVFHALLLTLYLCFLFISAVYITLGLSHQSEHFPKCPCWGTLRISPHSPPHVPLGSGHPLLGM